MVLLLSCIYAIRSTIRLTFTPLQQDFDAPFLVETGDLIEGEFPPKAQAMVKEFILTYRHELLEMWETERYVKLPPIK